MPRQRGEEVWARICIENARPDTTVVLHDDGTANGMHDLDLVRDGRRYGACEVTSVADGEFIQLWNLVNGGGAWFLPEINGGWYVVLAMSARVKVLRRELSKALHCFELHGIREVHARDESVYGMMLRELKAVHAWQSPSEQHGKVSFTVDLPQDRNGGFVPNSGNALVAWLDGWINAPEQMDNVSKLASSGAEEGHLYVIFAGFAPAPFQATDVLMRPSGPLPTVSPMLPIGVTHLWVMSTWSSGDVFSWDAVEGWQRHEKVTTIH